MRSNPSAPQLSLTHPKRAGAIVGIATLAVFMIAVAGGGMADAAGSCAMNFYRCALNNGGRVDPVHPGCCWNLSTACPAHFYKCSLNRGGRVDSQNPDCCWDLTR